MEKFEEYAYILDFLPQGRYDDKRIKKEPLALALGDAEFKLFELIIKPNITPSIGDRVYIGKEIDKRKEIHQIKRRIGYKELTPTAQVELPYVVLQIVHEQEKRFVDFYNNAPPITTRLHMLELLPGLGKKTMWVVIEERKKGPFTSFEDISKRTKIHAPDKLIADRIKLELEHPEEKYHIFVAK
jgi:putative nucleotide binding protein